MTQVIKDCIKPKCTCWLKVCTPRVEDEVTTLKSSLLGKAGTQTAAEGRAQDLPSLTHLPETAMLTPSATFL